MNSRSEVNLPVREDLPTQAGTEQGWVGPDYSPGKFKLSVGVVTYSGNLSSRDMVGDNTDL